MTFLHVYPAGAWHDPVLIAGSISGIEALRDACQEALNNGHHGSAQAFTGDGEGYALLVEVQTSEEMEELPMHYIEDCAEDTRGVAADNLRALRIEAYDRYRSKC